MAQPHKIPFTPAKPAPVQVSLADVSEGFVEEPFRIALYGVPGIGKSTFAAGSPAPIFLDVERGTTKLRTKRYFVDTWPQYLAYLDKLRTDPHAYQTVITDTVDALEKKLWLHMCAEKNYQGIEDFGFGKGYTAALEHWREAVYKLERLRLERGMNVMFLGHAQIKAFKDPESEGYDRYQMELHDKSAAFIRGWCETVLFCNYETWVKKDGKKRSIGYSSGDRLIYTERSAAYEAKNRDNLPARLPLDWQAYVEAVKENRPTAKLRAQIAELLTEVNDELRAKCQGYVDSHPEDEPYLTRLLNKLQATLNLQENAA